jgi:aminoglycoside phosphotransferase (APT) family kinase protein
LSNLLEPWTISNATSEWPRVHADRAFVHPSRSDSKNSDYPGLPTKEQAIQWYCETSGVKIPEKELSWAAGFQLFRDCVIFQGIAARYAVRQASSERAMTYGREMKPFAEMAWKLVEETKEKKGSQAKL